ncbi:cyclase [Nonomuraea sp. WAC 01424]|uniref:SRPBCC family protein n=1 Tax=Nonomuraea sp. WAC 01424 TaxID=2203200 RepID=UPI000F787903|nr:SRPBCC family protein [Nonomuraea sp. WAC 01424]RSN14528.1 cyclase [Nonomuraea sp. WAC 01424]
MSRFEIVTLVLAPPDLLFDTSLSVETHTSSMAGSSERAVAGVTTGLLTLGDQVTWQARHFGLTWRMTSTIIAWERPTYFVDEQLKGPFRHWRHEHHFEPAPDADATLMTDVIDFSAPAGPLGRLVDRLVLRRHMTHLMDTRNRHIRTTLEH